MDAHARSSDLRTDLPSACPMAAHDLPHPVAPAHAGWPSGPAGGPLGWGLLVEMSRDLLGSLTRWQRDHGDLVHLRIWPEHEILLAHPDDVRDLLVTHHDTLVRWERGRRIFADVQRQTVLTTEGRTWQERRHVLQPAFAPMAVAGFAPSMAQAVQESLARWPQASDRWPVDQACTQVALQVIARAMFGAGLAPDEARDAEAAVHVLLVEMHEQMYWPASIPRWAPWKTAQRHALRTLRALVERRVAERVAPARAADPADPADPADGDLLARLLRMRAHDPERWTLRTVRDECMTALLAGHETIAATLTWWAWCMAADPAVQEAVAAEVRQVLGGRPPDAQAPRRLPLLTASLHETLRLYPAAPMLMTRRTTQPLVLGGWRFPARTLLAISVHLMQRDARWWPEPMAFRPGRFMSGGDAERAPRGAWMPFGAGPRVCLGQHLALAEMLVTAALIVQQFELRPAPGLPPPEETMSISLRPRDALMLRVRRLA